MGERITKLSKTQSLSDDRLREIEKLPDISDSQSVAGCGRVAVVSAAAMGRSAAAHGGARLGV